MFSYLAVSIATSKLSFADCLPPETSCCLELLHASRAKGHGLEETVSDPETLHFTFLIPKKYSLHKNPILQATAAHG
jgi:hypothetical protein